MFTNFNVEIDVFKFIKKGTFDCLTIGASKEWVLNNFPLPDGLDREDALKFKSSDIWLYGDFQLFFEKQTLVMIYADYWGDELKGGKNLIVKHWLTKQESPATLQQMLLALTQSRIDFEKIGCNITDNIRLVLKASKIDLVFEAAHDEQGVEKSDPNQWIWCSLSKK